MSTSSIIPEPGHELNCPCCGGQDTVPVESLFRWNLEPSPRILVMGTCTVCGSTRTQWRETPSGDRIYDQTAAS